MKDMEFFKSSNELEALKKENIRLNRRNLFLENRNFELE
jgi:hypothetical protein